MASEYRDVSSPPPALCQRNGFTLIEILTALVIMAIIAALAIPRLNLEGYKVGSAVRGITAGLSYAQRLAVSLQSDVRVSFDSTRRRLQVHEDTDNNGVVDPGERVTYTNLEEGVTFGRGAATPITYSDGTQGNGTFNFAGTQNGLPCIVFRRDGSASENGGFYLNTIKAMVRGQANAVRAAEIVRSSGKVIWYSYGSGAWTRGN